VGCNGHQAQAAGTTTQRQIAAALTARGIPSASGNGAWHAGSVRRVLAYANHDGPALARAAVRAQPRAGAVQYLGL